ncbi:ribonuclease III [[Mycoplasma] testudinis]|uniref:ribonuclease III n=1 Tax=[Mycoplasma] testudinis TaxID=33924 RepID=UPI0006980568|nr:ribonuclease III [[Mycoplasma] testudinis]
MKKTKNLESPTLEIIPTKNNFVVNPSKNNHSYKTDKKNSLLARLGGSSKRKSTLTPKFIATSEFDFSSAPHLNVSNQNQKTIPLNKKSKPDFQKTQQRFKFNREKISGSINNMPTKTIDKLFNGTHFAPSHTTQNHLLTHRPYHDSSQVLYKDLEKNILFSKHENKNKDYKKDKLNQKQISKSEQQNKDMLPSWAITRIETNPSFRENSQTVAIETKTAPDIFVDIAHHKEIPMSRDLVPVAPKVVVYPTADNKIAELLEILKIVPNDISLFEEALTHNSYANETVGKRNYQRLEFLGDSIINKLVTVFLYSMSEDDEGHMTKDRISIIQAKTLARASTDLNLGAYLQVGQGLKNRPVSESILEDIFESFIGAVFLDQGEVVANRLLMKTIIKYYLNDDLRNTIDYKTQFQEAMQEHGKQTNIVYKKLHGDGSNFEVELICNGITYGRGYAGKLHDAEVLAAKEACEKISKVRSKTNSK